jgi:hypothetical protein
MILMNLGAMLKMHTYKRTIKKGFIPFVAQSLVTSFKVDVSLLVKPFMVSSQVEWHGND